MKRLLLAVVIMGLGASCTTATPKAPAPAAGSPPSATPVATRAYGKPLDSPAYDRFLQYYGYPLPGGEKRGWGSGAIIYSKESPNGDYEFTGAKDAATGILYLPAQPEMGFMIMYDHRSKTKPPPMQFQILARTDGPYGFVGNLSDPVMVCDLDADQCEHVLQRGVPPKLIEEMVRVALEKGWRSIWEETHIYQRLVYVDPDPFFESVGHAK